MRRIDDDGGRSLRWKTTAMAMLLASRGRVRRVCSSTGSGRSLGMRRGSEEVAVAAVVASGGDERARVREGESREGRRGSGESEREERGGCVASPEEARAKRQAGGGRGGVGAHHRAELAAIVAVPMATGHP